MERSKAPGGNTLDPGIGGPSTLRCYFAFDAVLSSILACYTSPDIAAISQTRGKCSVVGTFR